MLRDIVSGEVVDDASADDYDGDDDGFDDDALVASRKEMEVVECAVLGGAYTECGGCNNVTHVRWDFVSVMMNVGRGV